MLLDIRDYTIGAGATISIQIPARFFQLMESTADVNISVLRSNSRLGYMQNMPQGVSFGPLTKDEPPFHEVQIYSASAQTVKVCLADGPADLRNMSGSVSISGGTLNYLGQILNPTPPQTMVSSYSNTALSTTLVTVVTPAANVWGVRIDGIYFCNQSVAGMSGRAMSKTSAPSAWNDATARGLGMFSRGSDGSQYAVNLPAYPIIVPGGEGIYAQTSGGNCQFDMSYEVLT